MVRRVQTIPGINSRNPQGNPKLQLLKKMEMLLFTGMGDQLRMTGILLQRLKILRVIRFTEPRIKVLLIPEL